MKILLIAEHDNKKLNAVNYSVLTAALQFKGEIDVLVMGHACAAVVQEIQQLPAIQKIKVADAADYAHALAENSAALIAELARDYAIILMAATTSGKNILPRAAALLDMALVGDVVKIISPNTFERYIYAGNVLATLVISEPIKILTIRPTAFAAALPQQTQTATVEIINKIIPNAVAKLESRAQTVTARPALTAARIILAGGRGLKNVENFKLLEKLADRLGAGVAASRAAVDAGFAPNDYQVGQTGKIVAPDLYIAIGISGAVQHLAGMKESKVIVAINNDPEAPIFAIADYGLVMDLFSALIELEALLFKNTSCN
jgi:electron transfer flavoprotein alpha subunit